MQYFGDIPGVIIYINDFLIYGDEESHDKQLGAVLERAQQIGLKFNKEKCQFCVSQVKYLGHIFNKEGMSMDPLRSKAIKELPEPKNLKDLQRFLGMINFIGSYISNLSLRTTQLRSLLRKDIKWQWTQSHRDEFIALKEVVASTPVLIYLDPSKEITLSVDASKDALGAVIIHENRPIAYASTTLRNTQSVYSQIEKELLAVVYGCLKFHQYIYGREVTVHTDHKPLVSIINKPFKDVPPRLQRMILKLQGYNLNLMYVPGKEMFNLIRCQEQQQGKIRL